MDPRNASEMFKHLEKQKELLQDAHNKMSHELHRLQVEEEMLMRKFYELTSTLGLNKKNDRIAFNNAENEESDDAGHDKSKALVNVPSDRL